MSFYNRFSTYMCSWVYNHTCMCALPLSREDVTYHMKDAPEGSFLVRDAARVAGYYTLTLK